jgi:DNA-binding NtrC family response regulator
MMKRDNGGLFKQTFSLNNCTGRLQKSELERAPLPDTARRFSCVFLSTSVKDAVRLNQHLSAAGIRVYHAGDAREAEVILAITSARILLVDIDRTIQPSLEILQKLDESHPNVPKVLLTSRNKNFSSLILSHFVLDVVPKPVHLGDLLCALEYAHSVQEELYDPETTSAIEARVLAAIGSASEPRA